MRTHTDIAVIGGGQAGLACGYYLRRAGLDHVILDQQDAPGGAWQATWPSLRLFSSSDHSSLPGRQMPPHPDTFPPVGHALDYLTEYEHRYELPIERPVSVADVRSLDDGLELVTDRGNLLAKYVINATGTWTAPFVPQVEGAQDFRGRQLHSAHYRGPQPFTDQRVAVVGGGNSGVQITADLVGHAEQVSLVSLHRLRFLPDDVDGRHLFEQATARLDQGAAEAAFVGNVVALPQVRAARAEGALRLRAMFDRMTPDGAVIGRNHLDLDTVIWCTGFRPALRHLRSLGLRTSKGIPDVIGNRAVKDARVCFVGYGDWTGPASATIIGVGRTAKALVAQLAGELASS